MTEVAAPIHDVAIAKVPPAFQPPPPIDCVKIAAQLISTVRMEPMLSRATWPPLPPPQSIDWANNLFPFADGVLAHA